MEESDAYFGVVVNVQPPVFTHLLTSPASSIPGDLSELAGQIAQRSARVIRRPRSNHPRSSYPPNRPLPRRRRIHSSRRYPRQSHRLRSRRPVPRQDRVPRPPRAPAPPQSRSGHRHPRWTELQAVNRSPPRPRQELPAPAVVPPLGVSRAVTALAVIDPQVRPGLFADLSVHPDRTMRERDQYPRCQYDTRRKNDLPVVR